MEYASDNSTDKFKRWHLLVIAALSGFLFAYIELLLNNVLIGVPEFFYFDCRYLAFGVLMFIFIGALSLISSSPLFRKYLGDSASREKALFYSLLFTAILILFNNTQLNYLKEFYGDPDTFTDNIIFNLVIIALGYCLYRYLRRKDSAGQLVAVLAGSIILPITLSYLGPRFQGGALGSEDAVSAKYNMVYLFFLSAYLFLLLAGLSGFIYKKYGSSVLLIFLLGITIQSKLNTFNALLIYGIISIVIIITLQKTNQLNRRSALFPLTFFYTCWFLHPYLFESNFPLLSVKIYNSPATIPWIFYFYLIPLIKLALVLLILQTLSTRVVDSLRRKELSFSGTAWVLAGFLLFIFVEKGSYLETVYVNEASHSANIEMNQNAPNVILIALDTTCQDHLSVYQYPRETTPELSKFAQSATLYTNGYSAAGYTYPSHASLFTGMFPYVHGLHSKSSGNRTLEVNHRESLRLSSNNLTLAEILRDRGYVTVALSSHPFLHGLNLTEGFDLVKDSFKHFQFCYSINNLVFKYPLEKLGLFWMDLEQTTRAQGATFEASKWIKKHPGRPFFMFINFFDAHTPYQPLRKYRNLFTNETLLPRYQAESAQIKHDINCYDEEIVGIDQSLGELFDNLKALDKFDNTIICLVGDHGESFGENSYYGHGTVIYNAVIKVPFIIKFPGQRDPRRVEQNVSLVDIFPTVLQILGYPVPGNIQGTALNGNQPNSFDRPIIAEGYFVKEDKSIFPRRALFEPSFKLSEQAADSTLLFNLTKDPLELTNIAGDSPLLADSLKLKLDNLISSLDTLRVSDASPDKNRVSQETIEGLKALGYVK